MKRYRRILASLLAGVLVINIATSDILANAAVTGTANNQTTTTEQTDTIQDAEDSTQKEEGTSENVGEADVVDHDSADTTQSDTGNDTSLPADGSAQNDGNAGNDTVSLLSAAGTLDLTTLLGSTSSSLKGTAEEVTVESPQGLVLLSNCKPEQLQNLKIKINASGSSWKLYFSGTDTKPSWDGTEYTYNPIGTAEFPFQGSVSVQGSSGVTLQVNTTLFGVLSSDATNNGINIQWDGGGTCPILAEKYVLKDSAEKSFPFKISNADSCLIGEISGNGTLTVDSEISYKTGSATSPHVVSVNNATGNAGLICNTLSQNATIVLGSDYKFPGETKTGTTATWSVTGKDGAAGGLIGAMTEGTKLVVKHSLTTKPSGLAVTTTGNAGGLVGTMAAGAEIETASDTSITLEMPTISGTGNVGGLVGQATNVLWDKVYGSVAVNDASVKGNADAANVGGFIGQYELNTRIIEFPKNITIENPTVSITTGNTEKGNAGGYFGLLQLFNSSIYTIGSDVQNTETTESNQRTVNLAKDAKVNTYGAIAGAVISNTGAANSLLIKNQNIQSIAHNASPKYHGGLIGKLGNGKKEDAVYAEFADNMVEIQDPFAADHQSGFGGTISYLADYSVLNIQNITVKTGISTENTNKDPNIWEGGGIVGYAGKGSAIEFSGTTDLSEVHYTGSDTVGQLVAKQNDALIYARGDGNGNGWTYKRSKNNDLALYRKDHGNSARVNDIGNYGEVIRLKPNVSSGAESGNTGYITGLNSDLISMDATIHNVTVKQITAGSYQTDAIDIASTDEFALLAITWNTEGYFSADANMSNDKNVDAWKNLYQKNININADIDLTGTGILGLTRDNENKNIYTGAVNGNNHTVTLAIGESYGYIEDETQPVASGTDGSGVIYGYSNDVHSRLGMFARSSGNVSNLTIAGSIQFSNKYGEKASGIAKAGGIAAELVGNDSTAAISLSNVTADEKITVSSGLKEYGTTTNTNRTIIAGGLYGEQTGSLTLQLSSIKANSGISITAEEGADAGAIAGGVIGSVADSYFNLTVDGLDVSSKIVSSATKYAYVGGLIGVIGCSGSNNPVQINQHEVNINNLTFKGCQIKAESATEVCGGLLGSIWNNTKIVLSGTESNLALKVQDGTGSIDGNTGNSAGNKTSITANSGVGGLLYHLGGVMEINDYGIDISKLSISAGGAVGLLVCHGERGNETVSVAKMATNVKDSEINISALYLYTTANWKTAYTVSAQENDILITQSGQNPIFDEFVAYTAASAEKITSNGTTGDTVTEGNGIISLATETVSNQRVGVNPEKKCTTYQNRTVYGNSYKTNACSRYYYDLDAVMSKVKQEQSEDSRIDTPEKLLLWSVYQYADKALKSIFSDGSNTDVSDATIIGGSSEDDVAGLDLAVYSYYPINLDQKDVKVQNARITFHNDRIESGETADSANKSTIGKTSEHTQHYTMHCGLFLNHQFGTGTDTTPDQTTVQNVFFAGSIGKVNGGSGVLFAGNVQGASKDNQIIKANVTLKGVTFENLSVNDCGTDYAPLLINSIGSYSNLSVDTIKTDKYTEGTAVASSLIGKVGSDKADQIVLSFSNIKLPDKKADSSKAEGIFSHATLLESFQYASNSSASYTFYKKDDWKNLGQGTSEAYDHHNVTYGQEISETKKYEDRQKWYYDESTYKDDKGLVQWSDDQGKTWSHDFSSYLPYVCSYNQDKGTTYDEIKVNQRTYDILSGCGTYGHPYVIKTEGEAKAIADYINANTLAKDWRIRVVRDQGALCYHGQTSSGELNEYVMQYDGDRWKEVEEQGDSWVEKENGKQITSDVMRLYMANAYYDFQGEQTDTTSLLQMLRGTTETSYQLTLKNFDGFGSTAAYPFRGVITSTTGVTVILQGAQTGNGLIPYSYGSVVTNLKVSYEKSNTLQSGSEKSLTYNKNQDATYRYNPDTFFGGIIGCVLGGDNIIDNVTVDMENNWLFLDNEDNTAHLIPVGGYVGCISGGGVVFRNMGNISGLTNSAVQNGNVTESSTGSLYVNPYVGRVLDGYAFSEGCTINNTDKNYTINMLNTDDTGCVETSGGDSKDADTNTFPFTTTVTDKQGLLVLSAVINSGATAGGDNTAPSATSTDSPGTGTNAYNGKVYDTSSSGYSFGNGTFGKVRNADYQYIGKISEENKTKVEDDFDKSKADDQTAPGSGNTRQVNASRGENADTLNRCTNAPYLIRKYCNDATFYIVGGENRSVNISLTGTDYDMTAYGNGYQGLGARYRSNASRFTNGSSSKYQNTRIIPAIKSLNGINNGSIAKIKVNMQVKEYVDDDFPAASVGGVFNLFRSANTEIQNLTIGSDTESSGDSDNTKKTTISLQYYGNNGKESSDDKSSLNSKNNVGVGGLFGSDAGVAVAKGDSGMITLRDVNIQNMQITGPYTTGGLIGNVGQRVNYENSSTTDDPIKTLIGATEYTVDVTLTGCSFRELSVTGKYKAGGLVGYTASSKSKTPSSVSINVSDTGGDIESSDSYINTTIELGQKSDDAAKSDFSAAGGLVGLADAKLYVNKSSDQNRYYKLNDLRVLSNQHAGGVVGKVGQEYNINNVQLLNGSTIKGGALSGNDQDTYKSSAFAPTAGGIIGKADTSSSGTITKCQLQGGSIGTTDDGQINKHQSSGGIVGRLQSGKTQIQSCSVSETTINGGHSGGITGRTQVALVVSDCSVQGESESEEMEIIGNDVSGGMCGWVTDGTVTMERCYLKYCDIQTCETNANNYSWGAGTFAGDIDNKPVFYLYDCSAEYSCIKARDAGGIVGKCNNTLVGSNILLNHLKITGWDTTKNTTAILVGSNSQDNIVKIQIAGLSLQNINATRKAKDVTGLLNENVSADDYNSKGYITFADYTGTSVNNQTSDFAMKLTKTNTSGNLSIEASSKPYVTTSPKSKIQIKLADGSSAYLSGDGTASAEANSFSYAKTLIANGSKESDDHFAYSKTGVDITNEGAFAFSLDSYTSTYNENQTEQMGENFPVLLVSSGSDVTWLTTYLNLLTNGGFEAANTIGTTAVEAHTYACTKNSNEDSFTVDENSRDQTALRAVTKANNQIAFQTNGTEYDNTKDRFTLLAVTFWAGDGQYDLYIPVIVRRQMEVDFTATLDYGTQFDKTQYDSIPANAHVLESFGNTFSGYLTYTYNSANGEYADYGWQNYIDAGGNMMDAMSKSLVFSAMDTSNPYLPQGTQLSLIDCQHGDKVYYYTVSDSTTSQIPFSKFTDTSSTTKQGFEEESIGDLLNVEVAEESSGKFIEVDETGKPVGAAGSTTAYNRPTVKSGGKYYRLEQTGESNYTHYKITVNENNLKNGEQSNITENYYIVITVPENTSQSAVVGSLQTALSNDNIPVRLHYRLRSKDIQGNWTDEHINTASTYSISGGYNQELKENKEDIKLPPNTITDAKEISVSDSKMYIDVEDAITFPNNQVYNDDDELYQQFTGGMQKTEGDQAESILFPNGTTGMAQFYVYTRDSSGNIDAYYVYSEADGSWTKKEGAEASEPIPIGNSYRWMASDGTMKLPLSVSENGQNPISLKNLRKQLQNSNSDTSTFYVRIKMDAELPGTALSDIPVLKLENNVLKNFVKMNYSAQISTKASSLSYSNNRASTADTKVKYYREQQAGATLTYDAENIDQLGINLLDLDQNVDKDKKYALIETTAKYDLSTTENLQELLKSSNGVRFKMTLSPKDTSNTEAYLSPFTQNELSTYLDIQLNSKNSGTVAAGTASADSTTGSGAGTGSSTTESGTWTWTIPKESYCDANGNLISDKVVDANGNIISDKIFDASAKTFYQSVQLKVRVDNVEALKHLYSNYKVELTAEILDGSGNAVNTASDYLIYSLVKIKPEFVE